MASKGSSSSSSSGSSSKSSSSSSGSSTKQVSPATQAANPGKYSVSQINPALAGGTLANRGGSSASGIVSQLQNFGGTNNSGYGGAGSRSSGGSGGGGGSVQPPVPGAPVMPPPGNTPLPQTNVPAQMQEYNVQQGDNLSKIAQQAGMSLADLLAKNPNIKNPNLIVPGQKLSLGDQIKAGLAGTKASGSEAPTSPADAMGTVTGSIPVTPPPVASTPPTEAQGAMSIDKGWSDLQKAHQDQLNTLAQRESTVDVYKRLTKELGIPEINTQLTDMKKVIDGTENDIRKEVQAASGFATNSQVLAMASARNETLIKNYNALVDSRKMQMDYLDNMMKFVQDDNSYQMEKSKIIAQQAKEDIEYRDKYYQNTKENFNNIVKIVGYDGAYQAYKRDPAALAMVDNMMGLGTGGLKKLASLPPPEKERLAIELQKSQLLTDKYQRQNIISQINERANTSGEAVRTLNGKPQNAAQSKANGYADRMAQSNGILNGVEKQFKGITSGIGANLPNWMKSSDRQKFEQAKLNFVNAVLRQESGANIPQFEIDSAEKQYFAKPGDSKYVIEQKRQNRNTAINNFYREANIARPVTPGDIVQGGDGSKWVVGADGETLTKI